MNHCHLTQVYLNNKNKINKTPIQYKLQKIVGLDGLVLGYEVLINSNKVSTEVKDNIYHFDILFPHSTRSLLSHIENLGGRLRLFEGLFLFFNLERSNLCDKLLLCEIILLKEKLSVYGVSLVVEITERNYCKTCHEVQYGLQLLKSNNVILAADSLYVGNIHQDVRSQELQDNFYNFIKVEHQNDYEYYQNLKQLSKQHCFNIVIKRVESDSDLAFINDTNVEVWGYQGFLFQSSMGNSA